MDVAEGFFASLSASVTPLAGDRRPRLDALRARLGTGRFEAERLAPALAIEDAGAEALAWADPAEEP